MSVGHRIILASLVLPIWICLTVHAFASTNPPVGEPVQSFCASHDFVTDEVAGHRQRWWKPCSEVPWEGRA